MFCLEKLGPEKFRNTGNLAAVALCLLGQRALHFVHFGDWIWLVTILCRCIPFYILGIVMQEKEYQGLFSNL